MQPDEKESEAGDWRWELRTTFSEPTSPSLDANNLLGLAALARSVYGLEVVADRVIGQLLLDSIQFAQAELQGLAHAKTRALLEYARGFLLLNEPPTEADVKIINSANRSKYPHGVPSSYKDYNRAWGLVLYERSLRSSDDSTRNVRTGNRYQDAALAALISAVELFVNAKHVEVIAARAEKRRKRVLVFKVVVFGAALVVALAVAIVSFAGRSPSLANVTSRRTPFPAASTNSIHGMGDWCENAGIYDKAQPAHTPLLVFVLEDKPTACPEHTIGPLKPGSKFQVWINYENSSGVDLKNVRLVGFESSDLEAEDPAHVTIALTGSQKSRSLNVDQLFGSGVDLGAIGDGEEAYFAITVDVVGAAVCGENADYVGFHFPGDPQSAWQTEDILVQGEKC